jgi:hypothetical protein
MGFVDDFAQMARGAAAQEPFEAFNQNAIAIGRHRCFSRKRTAGGGCCRLKER